MFTFPAIRIPLGPLYIGSRTTSTYGLQSDGPLLMVVWRFRALAPPNPGALPLIIILSWWIVANYTLTNKDLYPFTIWYIRNSNESKLVDILAHCPIGYLVLYILHRMMRCHSNWIISSTLLLSLVITFFFLSIGIHYILSILLLYIFSKESHYIPFGKPSINWYAQNCLCFE